MPHTYPGVLAPRYDPRSIATRSLELKIDLIPNILIPVIVANHTADVAQRD
jgi:hypothetical protein